MFRSATTADADAIARIYNPYVVDTVATFEEAPVAVVEMAQRVRSVLASELPWLVAEEAGEVVGYAYAARWRPRNAYRFAAETTIYLDPGAIGRGLGTELYAALFDALRARAMRVAIGGIALPNPASVALHEKLGMSKVAHFADVGFKLDRWVDVGYWQLHL